jgi:hypothetical protein
VSGVGDTLLNHVSSSGTLAAPDPGVVVAKGTVQALAVDSDSHAVVLLGSPGRTGLAVQRYDAAIAADWAAPVTPYNPLLGPPPAATPEAIDIVASATAAIAWRENSRVRTQRFSLSGSRLWLTPASVTMAGDVKLADDGIGGSYLTGPSGAGIVVRHLLASGAEATGSPSALPGLGLSQPSVDGVSGNRAGDLTVAYSDSASTGTPGVARVTCLGVWTTASLVTSPAYFTAAAHDGAGGAYILGGGGGAALLRVADADWVTLRARAKLVRYGKSVTVAGYHTGVGGLPVAQAQVQVRRVTGAGTAAGGSDTTDAQGYYQISLQPRSNATWRAVAGGVAGGETRILVMPRVTLALSHLKAGRVLTEIFTGSVAPAHDGRRVFIKRAVGSGWRTVASGRLDSRSRFHISWRLPYRTATYKVRVVFPKDADHAEGTSITATLKVVIKKG